MGHDPLHLHHRPVLGARNYRKGARDHPMLRPRLQGVCALQPYDERLQPYDERLQPQRAAGLQLSLYDERRAAAALCCQLPPYVCPICIRARWGITRDELSRCDSVRIGACIAAMFISMAVQVSTYTVTLLKVSPCTQRCAPRCACLWAGRPEVSRDCGAC